MPDNTKSRRRARESKVEKPASSLIRALKFVGIAQSKGPEDWCRHCVLNSGRLYATNGKISAGCTVTEDLTAFPNTKLFLSALEECGDKFTLTNMDNGLIVQSGPFLANIPCSSSENMIYIGPDSPQGVVSDTIKNGIKLVLPLVKERGEFLAEASILISNSKLYATDRHIVVEFNHGWYIPFDIVISKSLAKSIASVKSPLSQIGTSVDSVTFWFENGSFIKGPRFTEEWPNVKSFFEKIMNPVDIPDNFFEAVNSSLHFSIDGKVTFRNGIAESSRGQYDILGLPEGLTIYGKSVMFFKGIADKYELSADGKFILIGNNIRGITEGM